MKQLISILLHLILLVLTSSVVQAQRCISSEVFRSKPAELQVLQTKFYERENNQPVVLKRYQDCTDGVHRIPVVVHIIHHGGVENISDAQVLSNMASINEDYRKMTGTRGDGKGVDTRIEFYLATIDPYGNPTTGIERINDTLSLLKYKPKTDTLLKRFNWPQQKYMNVYVVDTLDISFYGGTYALGVSEFPADGHNLLDGLIIQDGEFGDSTGTSSFRFPTSYGRTFTHEAGHWLGLFHPFECRDGSNSCCQGTSPSTCDTSGDFVCDTRPQNGPHFGNPILPINTCTETPYDSADQTFLYMDYVDDIAMNGFTQGQANRMNNELELDTGRMNLGSSLNIIQTGVRYYGMPDPHFAAKAYGPAVFNAVPLAPLIQITICTGDTVQFYDLSPGTMYGYIPGSMPATPDTRWEWKLYGATPDTSNAQHPRVYYSAPGTYLVKLTVRNSHGFCTRIIPYVVVNGANLTATSDSVSFTHANSFTATSSQPGNFRWAFGDGFLGMGMNTTHTYLTMGTFNFKLTFTPFDITQCTAHAYGLAKVGPPPPPPLPVELVDFSCEKSEGGNILLWQTASEYNSDYFLLQKSKNNMLFEDIEKIPAAGNSTQFKNYTYTDVHDIKEDNYYRLKQVDVNGEYQYSKVIYIHRTVSESPFKIYPTFFGNSIEINPGENNTDAFYLLNTLGEAVYYCAIAGGEKKKIDLPPMPNGFYKAVFLYQNRFIQSMTVIKI